MHGKIAEIHIVGGRVYETRVALKDLERVLKEEFVKIHRGCIVSVKAVHDVTDTVNLSDGEKLLYTVRKKKQIVSEIQEKQKKIIHALEKKVFRLQKKNIAVIIVLLNIFPLHLRT